MIADYFVIRHIERSRVDDLYGHRGGAYEYSGGVNSRAVAALAAGIAVAHILGLAVEPLRFLYDYAWFVGFGVAGAMYILLMGGKR